MTTNALAFTADHFDLASEHTGRTYRVTVEVPNRYSASTKSYPVVVVLDGQWIYGLVRDAFRVLPLDRELPEAIVVGVAHNTPKFHQLLQDRAADFTPTQASSPPETGVREAGPHHRTYRESIEATNRRLASELALHQRHR